jgi:hypothetical protein
VAKSRFDVGVEAQADSRQRTATNIRQVLAELFNDIMNIPFSMNL